MYINCSGGGAAAVDLSGDVDIAEAVPAAVATRTGKGSTPDNDQRGGSRRQNKAYSVPVDGAMSSYYPRDLVCESTGVGAASSNQGSPGDAVLAVAWRARGGGGAGRARRGDVDMDDLKAYEIIGIIIGANLAREKVRKEV